MISLITVVHLKFPATVITSFTLFWNILELFHQREQVRKGWFSGKAAKKNPNKRFRGNMIPLHGAGRSVILAVQCDINSC